MSRGGCGAENSVEDTEELAAKAAALKAKQDKAESCESSQADATQAARVEMALAAAPVYGLVDMHHHLRSVKC